MVDNNVLKLNEDKTNIKYYQLPSTSPANASKRFDEKLAEWKLILDLLKY